MVSYKTLLNASNLHVGGGVQVATSVIAELTRLPALPDGLFVWSSKEVHRNLEEQKCEISRLPNYRVVDLNGFWISRTVKQQLRDFDAIFTIFGPLYAHCKGYNVVGFAQPWLIYPNNEIYREAGLFTKARLRLKYSLQSLYFRRADRVVVELGHVRERLSQVGIARKSNISVVHNCLSSIYRSPENWMDITIPDDGELKLGFVGRNYPHKNTRIFPRIVNALQRLHGISARIFVTFTNAEWHACGADFRAIAVNVGPLTVSQCPSFYRQIDAVVFPSLLECFSATPLEAMAMCKPLFASDRPFNRDVCGDHAYYFDPLDPDAAADQISKVFLAGSDDGSRLMQAQAHAFEFANARERALAYLEILNAGYKK